MWSFSISDTSNFFSRSFFRRFFLGLLNLAAAASATSAADMNSAMFFLSTSAVSTTALADTPDSDAASLRLMSAFRFSSAASIVPPASSVSPSSASSSSSSYLARIFLPVSSSSAPKGLSLRFVAAFRAFCRLCSCATLMFSSSSSSSLIPWSLSSRMDESFRVKIMVSPSLTSSSPCRTLSPARSLPP